MSKELKIGIITLITLIILIWGFQYLKGKNLLKKGYSFTAVYSDVEGLANASPVQINGLTVGNISNIEVNPDDVSTMIVSIDIEGEFRLPKDTRAINAAPSGVIGNRKIILEFDHLCSGDDCLKGGERLESGVRGILASVIGKDEVDEVIVGLRSNLGPMMDTIIHRLTSEDQEHSISSSLNNLDEVTNNLASLTGNLDRLLKSSYGNLNATMENLAQVTETFATTKDDMEKMIKNLSSFSAQVVDADVGGTLTKTSETVESTNKLLNELKSTVEQANESFVSVNSLLTKVDTGEGTIGRLLNDPEVYYNLEATSKHLALLLQDLRLNPKRYVRLSVFGRKGNPYTNPDDDPAFTQDTLMTGSN